MIWDWINKPDVSDKDVSDKDVPDKDCELFENVPYNIVKYYDPVETKQRIVHYIVLSEIKEFNRDALYSIPLVKEPTDFFSLLKNFLEKLVISKRIEINGKDTKFSYTYDEYYSALEEFMEIQNKPKKNIVRRFMFNLITISSFYSFFFADNIDCFSNGILFLGLCTYNFI
jgi:hypothetical protein